MKNMKRTLALTLNNKRPLRPLFMAFTAIL